MHNHSLISSNKIIQYLFGQSVKFFLWFFFLWNI